MTFAVKIKSKITLPQFKFVVEVPRYLRIESAIYLGKEMKPAEGKKAMEPAHLARVTDLETGELGEVIVPAVLMSTLQEAMPNDSYVGKCFAITKQKRQEGKRYDKFGVDEIEDPNAPEAPPAPAASDVSAPAATAPTKASGSKRN